jgi:membrane protein
MRLEEVTETMLKRHMGQTIREFCHNFLGLLRDTLGCWIDDHATRMAASLSFYTVFSIGPALLIGLSIAEAFVGTAAQSELASQLQQFIGPADPEYVLGLLESSRGKIAGQGLPLLGIIAAAATAMAVFSELQSSMSTIWNVKSPTGLGVLRFIYSRAISFVLVLGIGFLVMISVLIGGITSSVQSVFYHYLPDYSDVVQRLNSMVSLAMLPSLLLLAYKFIPPVRVPWPSAFVGASTAWLLLLLGKSVVGIYLGFSGLRSVYGAAGSLVIMLIWVYYSAQIFFFGAELTKVFTRNYSARQTG